MSGRFTATHVVVACVIGLALGMAAKPRPEAQEAEAAEPEVLAAVCKSLGALPDRIRVDESGGITFLTPAEDGSPTKMMRLTEKGCLLLGQRGRIAGIEGTMELTMNWPSRPGSIVMNNEHEPIRGVGDTLAFYASGEHQCSFSSSWLGETRRVKQIEKPPLPHGRESPPYPGPRSAARLEINARVNDWTSNVAMFEPIADDGRALVTADREHPWMNQIQYLPPGGEWLNNRRIGRHAFLVGTTHSTGATAGGIVLAGDLYHEYQGKGPVIKSPNGTAYRIVVDDEGRLSTEKF